MDSSVNVLVLTDFKEAIMEKLKQVSPKLAFTQLAAKTTNDVPQAVWEKTDILYTGGLLPDPNRVPRLRWVQGHFAGVDHIINHPLLQTEDIIVTTTNGIHATTLAELAFAFILAFARKIPLLLRQQEKAEWHPDRFNYFLPQELRGSTLGILGYGAIGREIARLAKAFGMEVLASKRDVKNPTAEDGWVLPGTGDPDGSQVDRLYPPEAIRSLVSTCDFVVVLIPLTSATQGVINADILAAMKKTAVLINIARGAVVDEAALIKALQNKQIAGAALDVFTQEPLPSSSPLWKLDNIILSPHIGGNTAHYHDNAALVFAENLRRFLDNRTLLNIVDKRYGY